MRLKGKIAIVTGAAQGIGRGIALEFAKEGADMMLMDLQGDKLAKTAKEIEALGRKVTTCVGNVADKETVVACVNKTVETFGRIDIMMHAAGILFSSSIIDLDIKNWQRVVDVNLLSSFLFCKYVGKQMVEQKSGAMILIDSCASKTGEAFNAVYCASKAGVRLLGQSFALEVAASGVRVNTIAPGTINTDMIDKCLHERAPMFGLTYEEYLDQFNSETPLKRMGEPEEIGKLCVFLASDDASFITGSSYNISGGRENH
ncbi:MAG: SDR family oxidoreductase [Eubacterium sp.]|nr:SDR family oxidoreductase [Eubacterium sp.]